MKLAAVVLLMSALSPLAVSQQICGAPTLTLPNGKTAVGCPRGTSIDSCNISLSFILCLKNNTTLPDPAILVEQDDLITWYSDQAGSNGKRVRMRFDKFEEELQDPSHQQHLECGAAKTNVLPFTDDFGEGKEKYSLRKATIVRQDAPLGACFKHHIWVREDSVPPPSTETNLDPHVIIGNPSYFVFKVDFNGRPIDIAHSRKASKP